MAIASCASIVVPVRLCGLASLPGSLWRPRWLARAWRFAECIFDKELQRRQRRPDNPLSLFVPSKVLSVTAT